MTTTNAGNWHLPAAAVEVLPGYDYSTILYAGSSDVWVPSDPPSEKPQKLGTFAAVELLRVPGERGNQQHLLDALCSTGGVIWKLDWVPLQQHDNEEGAIETEFFLAAIHPKGSELNKVNTPQTGPACLQLWSVTPASDGSGAAAAPKCEYTLVHDGKLTWDLQWLPHTVRQRHQQRSQQQAGGYDVLGVVALVLGDGTISITACPEPGQIKTAAAAGAAGGGEAGPSGAVPPPALAVKPLFLLNQGISTGSVPSCCDWLPQAPHNKLLVGCWDGSAACWQLPFKDGVLQGDQPPQLLYHLQVDPLALRAVRWAPARPFSCQDACSQHMFAAVGHGGRLHMMDPRTPVRPAWTKILNRTSWTLDLAWSGSPHCLATAQEDGELRLLPMAPSFLAVIKEQVVSTLKGCSSSTLWSISHSPKAGVMAFCGDEAVVGLQHVELSLDPRYRRPQAILGGLQRGADGAVKVASLPDFVNVHGGTSLVGQGGVYFRQRYSELREELPPGRAFADDQQCLYCVKFSPNMYGGTQWLAYGGAGGLVRVQKLSFHVRGV